VPVRVQRADLVGAARLVFTYPPGYDQAQAEVLGNAADWLAMSEAADGEMLLGLVSTASDAEAPNDLVLVLRFRSSAGSASLATGVALAQQEFAGRDGVLLAPSAPNTSVPSSAMKLVLSEARPNPFTRETRFVLGLSHASHAEVGVFDLSGRRVVTLHRGALEAGEHPFRWDGTQADGARAVDGVYFYRAQAGVASMTRKLVLLRGR
jgi:hypothetical protein